MWGKVGVGGGWWVGVLDCNVLSAAERERSKLLCETLPDRVNASVAVFLGTGHDILCLKSVCSGCERPQIVMVCIVCLILGDSKT